MRREDIIIDGRLDLTRLPLPQVYHQPKGGDHHPVYGLKDVLERPDEFDRTFKRPVVTPDGVLEYRRSEFKPDLWPDDISGYKRDPANPWRFIPAWDPCVHRLQGIQFKPNGCIELHMACNHPEAATYGTEVFPQTCGSCVLRATCKTDRAHMRVPRKMIEERDFQQPTIEPDGAMVYPKTGWEPPVCPEGYHVDPANRWRFIPDWKPCVHRSFDNTVRPCGCISIHAVCHSKESGVQGEQIPYVVCEKCPVRKEPEVHSIK